MKILLIEDDPQTCDYVCKGLMQKGHVVDAAKDGVEGWELVSTREYDVAIVDRMLPGMDGLQLIRELRRSGSPVRILMLTAMGRTDDRVEGLTSGADDYLTKPFAFAELMARINALSRRSGDEAKPLILTLADLQLDTSMHSVRRGDLEIKLHSREYQLLAYFLRNIGRTVTRPMLLERVWDISFDPKTNVVETHVSRLRAKVDGPFRIKLIHTVRGIGYRMSLDA